MRFNTDNRQQPDRPARDRARELRRNATIPERRLWKLLRADRLIVDGVPVHFRRQHPIGPYTADFACAALRLVIELDGQEHDVEHDRRRDAILNSLGWRTLRYPVHHFVRFESSVLQDIAAAVRARRAGQ